jgi:hypothetical protein
MDAQAEVSGIPKSRFKHPSILGNSGHLTLNLCGVAIWGTGFDMPRLEVAGVRWVMSVVKGINVHSRGGLRQNLVLRPLR